MKLAFTAQGAEWDSPMDPRFGRARFFLVFDEASEAIETIDNRAGDDEAHGAGPRTARKLSELAADVLITGNGPGGNAAAVLQAAGIAVQVGAGEMTVRQALEAYRRGELRLNREEPSS